MQWNRKFTFILDENITPPKSTFNSCIFIKNDELLYTLFLYCMQVSV
jgi:hypothetical protein